MSFDICPYKREHASSFRDLNLEWLEQYFYVEPRDKELLEKCEETILDKGGYIFMAIIDDRPVGCFALIPKEEGVFELGKMAVSAKHQGKKVGQQLLEFCIAFAKEKGWRQVLLYSHTKLKSAIHIYKKYGFIPVEMETKTPYERSNIKMTLTL